MPERIIPEISEVNMTENSSNDDEYDEISKNLESQGVDEPKRGGKTSNKTRKKLDAEFENATLKDDTGEAFTMPNTNKELLDEEASEDDPETPDVKLQEQDSKEIDCTGNQTKISNGHVGNDRRELSEDMKEQVDTSKVNSQKLELASREHVKEDVGTELTEKPSKGRMDKGVKYSQVMQESMSERNPDLQTSSEEINQGTREISDDIDTGLDKWLSTVEKEISKDECQDVPDSDASTSKGSIPHRENNINVKTVEINDTPKDLNDVPSEAEEGGDEVNDEENRERMGHPTKPSEDNKELDELEMVEKTTKRISDESDTNIYPVKIVLAKITIEEKDNDNDRNQMQWNKVEVWESDAIPTPSSRIE